MFYMIFDLAMAAIMLLLGMWFYTSEGKAAKYLSGYNLKSADERKKYDEKYVITYFFGNSEALRHTVS